MAVMAGDEPQATRPQQIVVDLTWTEDGQDRRELFGPWTQGDPETEEGYVAHMVAAHGFLGEWRRVTGLTPDRAVVSIILDPGQWLRERKGSDDG